MHDFKTIIVEDEKLASENLLFKLNRNCPQLNVVAQCLSGETAVKAIHEHQPHLIFLDFELGTMNGFDVLDRFQNRQFEVIFTTNFNDHAINALNEYDPVYYLLKPVNERKLIDATSKAIEKVRARNKNGKEEIALHFQRKIEKIPFNQIAYCEADDTCTNIYLIDGTRKVVCKTLKNFTEKLPTNIFTRIHKKYTVNLPLIKSITKEDGKLYCVVPPSGKKLDVAQNRKKEFLSLL